VNREKHLLATMPTTRPEQAPEIDIVPRIASVNTHARSPPPPPAIFVFTIANDAISEKKTLYALS